MYAYFTRPPRGIGPALPRGEIVLEAPPVIPEAAGGALSQSLMMLPMLAGGGAMSLMFVGSGASPIMYLASGMYGLSTVGMLAMSFGRGGGDRNRRVATERRDYLRYLARLRKRVGEAGQQQHAAFSHAHPDPAALLGLALSQRLWERRPSDADFAVVRLAVGTQNLLTRLVPPETKPAEDLDPVAAGALRQFLHVHSTVDGVPVAVALRSFRRVRMFGEPAELRSLVRAMVAQLVTLHAPDDLRIAVCAGTGVASAWEWTKWLPHTQHLTRSDGAGPLRMIGTDLVAVERLLGRELDSRPRFQREGAKLSTRPHQLIVVDEITRPAHSQLDGLQGVCVLDLAGAFDQPEDRSDPSVLTIHLRDGQLELLSADETGPETTLKLGRADQLRVVESEALARQLAPVRLATGHEDAGSRDTEAVSFAGLHALGDPGLLNPAVVWAARAPRDHLRVAIGLGPNGNRVELDLKESALEGMGPHGMVIGATGSGKSELLRTLVLGLAVTHSSETLNLVLVDFKGGATFLGLERLPHVSAVITNLADELPLVDRGYDALHGELVRRQELLRRNGNFSSARDYEKARAAGASLAPLPSLLIVVDEFSELLATKPEFSELFVMIGRLGRSLGVHLLLSSQHLDEGRLRGLGTHLSYRIGLRTFSAMESRTVIGVADAYELPASPGHGYLLHDNTQLTRFKAGYVSGQYQPHRPGTGAAIGTHQMVLFTAAAVGAPTAAEESPELDELDSPDPKDPVMDGPSVLEVVVDRLHNSGPPAHQVWLPPLDAAPALGDLLDQDNPLGLLCVPVGIVDKPFEQRRDPLWTDLSGGSGHVAVVGGPRSGKSTLLATLVGSLAMTHSPAQVQFYCLDFGGGVLSGLADLPHVGSVVGRRDNELVRRTVAELTALLDQRELAFTAQDIASITHYRRGLAGGTGVSDGFGDAFLVIDGWPAFVQDYPQLEQPVTRLASRGLGYGIHIVLTANRWAEIRPAVRELLGTRLELRLGEPFESEINRRAAANVPERAPGRGITREGLHVLAALPRVDGRPHTRDLSPAMRGLANAARARWVGSPIAPAVRTLPADLSLAELPTPDGHKLPIGLDEEALAVVHLDFDVEPHLLVFGDTESGKSNLLRLIAHRIVEAYEPEEAKVIVVDYRRSLLDAVPDSYRIGYAASAEAVAPLVRDIVGAMRERLPGPDLTTEQLRDRSWWRGADLFVLVDDYDLVESAGGGPLAPFADLVPIGRDIGLHLVMTRSTGGAGRSSFEPVLRRMRETSVPGLLLSGSPDEGPLFGKVRPQPQPAGRGLLVDRRSGTRTVQTVHVTLPKDR